MILTMDWLVTGRPTEASFCMGNGAQCPSLAEELNKDCSIPVSFSCHAHPSWTKHLISSKRPRWLQHYALYGRQSPVIGSYVIEIEPGLWIIPRAGVILRIA